MDRVADYELVRQLGAGERSTVHLAVPPARLGLGDAQVALKVIAAPSADDARRRLTRELRLFATVRSPLLVTIHDAGQDDDRFFYAMPFFADGSLQDPAEPLTRERALAAVGDAARAAHALHEGGVVHRAIKPSNVLLTATGGVLADLGLAQLLAPGQTTTGIGSIGSVEYLHPDTVLGTPASRASDIWSLAVTLHRALTGTGVHPTANGRDPLLAVRTILTTPPALADGLRDDERRLIGAALGLAPGTEPTTALDLATGIDALR